MACTLSAGRAAQCRDAIGGIRELFFVLHSDVDGNVATSGSPVEVTDIGTVTIYRYVLPKNTGSFNEVPTVGESGVHYLQTVEMVLDKETAADHAELDELVKSRVMIFARTVGEQMWLFGKNMGMECSGGSWTSGTAAADRNGYALTFTGEELTPALKFVDTIKTTNWFDTMASGTVTVSPAY